nr:citrate synthase, glyoxysomal-like [Ipomoea batatas]
MESGDCSTVARGRLAVLSAHLAVSASINHDAPALEASVVSATALAPPPNLRGSLTIIDERTGQRYQVQVSEEGTVKAADLKKITTGKNDKGLKLYDPGYLNTAPVRSSISYIDGDEGILRYRGYPIEELAEKSSFLEVAYLLLYGNLPSEHQLADWEFAVSQHSAVPEGVLAYTGVWLRHYMPLRERTPSSEAAADKLGQVSVSNATKRRLAGSGA